MARTLIGNFKGPKGDKGDQGATGPKGEQGVQGEVGPAGGVNSVNGAQGDVVIGGTNLYTGTRDFSDSRWEGLIGWTIEQDKYKGFTVISRNSRWGGIDQLIDVKAGESYTISFFGKSETEFPVGVFGTNSQVLPEYKDCQLHTEWERYFLTFKAAEDGQTGIKIEYGGAEETIPRIYLCGIKLERGTVATDWSPAPEDLVYKWQTDGVLPHRYVVRWDKAQNTCTRIYDAEGITTDTMHFAYHGSVDAAYDNPFDKLYPWSHRKLCKADKAKYKELYEAGEDVMGAITMWEGEPGFKLGPSVPGMDMVYTPEFWMKQWEDGGYVYIGVADGPIYGWQYVPEMVLGRYLASDDGNDGLTSLAGDVPLADTVNIGQLHTKAKADHLTLDTIQTWDPETVLMVVEYANLNCQSAIGRSVDNLYRAQNEHPTANETSVNYVTLPVAMKDCLVPGAILAFGAANDRGTVARRAITNTEVVDGGIKVTFSGDPVTYTTDTFCSIHGLYNSPDEAIGSKSGYIGTDGRSLAYYRGRNCWGNCFHYVLGAYREQNTGHIWVAPDLETADELDALDKEKCIDTGCALPQGASGAEGSGYIKELHLLPDYPMAPFCKSIGGDSTKPVGDYVWWPALSAGNTICVAGASANSGLSVGRFTAYWHHASSPAWWGSAASLAFKNPKGGV